MLGTYTYKAHDKDGKLVEGKLKAPSIQEAFSEVKNMGLMAQKIVPEGKRETLDIKNAINKLKKEKNTLIRDIRRYIAFGASLVLMVLFLVFQFLALPILIGLFLMYLCFIGSIVSFFYYFSK